ncbi:MAG: TlpA family protein disulfide reductase [Calditrichaeota bacterium]|nr:MAG: TlpA family protein disulfide reductase [Calditrichota bacterium]
MARKKPRHPNKKPANDNLKTVRWILGIFVIIFIGFLVYQTSQSTSGTLGDKLPGGNIALRSIDGRTLKLDDFAGKVLIVDFWATWCPPCKKELPGYMHLYDRYHRQGLEIVGVTLQSGTLSEVKQFVQAAGINYPIVMGTNEIVSAFGGITGFPTTFVIDRTGKVQRRYEGYRPVSVFERDIRQFLNSN